MKKIVDSTPEPKHVDNVPDADVIESKPLSLPKPDKKTNNTALVIFIIVVVVVVVTVIIIRYRNKKKSEVISTENNITDGQ